MRAGLSIPCYIDALFPEVAVATLEILEQLGLEVGYPADQACCGQPMPISGCQPESAATEARSAGCSREFDRDVGPSGSRVHHVRFYLDAAEQTPAATQVRTAVRELVELLHDVEVAEFLRGDFTHKVDIQDSCGAICGLGCTRPSECVGEPAFSETRNLLAKVRGLGHVEPDLRDECCGFGGSFCVTDDAVSSKMGEDRVRDFHRHDAEYIASADMSCLLHPEGVIARLGLPMKVVHTAQILNGGPS